MVIFIDSSSLIKRYIEEKGSTEIDKYYINGNKICISPVTTLEVNSALNRKLDDGSIDKKAYEQAIFYWDIDYPQYTVIPYNEMLIEKSIYIIRTHKIKTLDSIQIGAAILSEAEECITSDIKMHKVMESGGISKSIYI